jgi:hypothetical protein
MRDPSFLTYFFFTILADRSRIIPLLELYMLYSNVECVADVCFIENFLFYKNLTIVTNQPTVLIHKKCILIQITS